MFKRGDKIEFDITDYAFGGKGISKINTDSERTLVFIPNTFPGQRVQAIISSKKNDLKGFYSLIPEKHKT